MVLIAAIAAESGYATIAFKDPTSVRMLATGYRAPVSASTVTAGLSLLRAAGVSSPVTWTPEAGTPGCWMASAET